MRRVTFVIIASLITLVCQAQSEHLQFKGIPMEGNVKDFVAKLESKGFTLLDNNDNTCFLAGSFAGYDDITVAVVGTPKTNTVYRVTAFFDKKDSFSSLLVQYESLVNSYTEKYGNPKQSYDFFLNPYYKGDGYEVQALRQNKCRYITFYETQSGNLSIEISKLQKVVVNYEDGKGVKKYNTEKNEIVDNDI